jgi:hypothetical protein
LPTCPADAGIAGPRRRLPTSGEDDFLAEGGPASSVSAHIAGNRHDGEPDPRPVNSLAPSSGNASLQAKGSKWHIGGPPPKSRNLSL